MLQRYLLMWLVLSSGVAAAWPLLNFPLDPFLESKSWLGVIVAVTMFCVGAILPKQEVFEVGKRWPLVLAGTAVQYGSMPLLAWGMATLFQVSPEIKIGMIMVGCVPGAMASNVLTLVAKGNVSYSVGLTTSATLLSPLIVPLVLKVTLGANATLKLLTDAAVQLCWQVVFPVAVGFVWSQQSASFRSLAERYAGALANLAILWIIAVVVALNRDRLAEFPAMLISALLLLNLFGYVAGYTGGSLLKLPVGMRRALMLEVGMQNAGVGASLATSLFPDTPGVSLPCGLFAFGCMFTGTILAQYLSRKPCSDRSHSPSEVTETQNGLG